MEPERISWQEAPDAILRRAREVRGGEEGDRPVVVGITGAVGAGKSTLASRLGGAVIRTDDYLPDYSRVEIERRDDPEEADLPLLRAQLEALRAGRAIEAPCWCFHAHRRTGTRTIEPRALVVVEGLHALHERVAEVIDVGVFVRAPAEVRWRRWETLERSGERGFGIERAREHFDGIAEPTFARYAEEYLSRAHILVHNGEPEQRNGA